MLAVEFVRPGTVEPDPATTKAVAAAAHQAGLIVLTCGSWGNVLRLLPPLAIGDDLLAEGLDVLADVLRSALEGVRARSERGRPPGLGAGEGVLHERDEDVDAGVGRARRPSATTGTSARERERVPHRVLGVAPVSGKSFTPTTNGTRRLSK